MKCKSCGDRIETVDFAMLPPLSEEQARVFRPPSYLFWPPDRKVNRKAVGRMIGNAVPPRLAKELGLAIMRHVVDFGGLLCLNKR